MSKGHHRAVAHSPIITVGDLIDELCRLPDTAVVHFRCPTLDQELTFERLRKRSKDDVEIAIAVYPESPPVVAASDGAFQPRRHNPSPRSLRDGAMLQNKRVS
ncbi:hypothetical protein ACFQZO_15220 [Bradyrhizobium sp. GCM10027634]|uniref:hypothetical protein n=1 Tax=unclassified Bradyrhizobium TaxID=2631580 RepID=UPI00188DB77B|nr:MULTISPECIES: hypothetical protein [unclassified Bradyrhizobium]MDN5002236.1 hypothetical protein [Bradyrhizobium sp. WYCCWR 12677]QOZ44298.1 hypothetical protein XH89_12995 [Bradyrhizobium sp. CCBAU 53340]